MAGAQELGPSSAALLDVLAGSWLELEPVLIGDAGVTSGGLQLWPVRQY